MLSVWLPIWKFASNITFLNIFCVFYIFLLCCFFICILVSLPHRSQSALTHWCWPITFDPMCLVTFPRYVDMSSMDNTLLLTARFSMSHCHHVCMVAEQNNRNRKHRRTRVPKSHLQKHLNKQHSWAEDIQWEEIIIWIENFNFLLDKLWPHPKLTA